MLTFTDGGLILIPGFLVPIAAVPFAVWILRREADPRWTIMALLGHAAVLAPDEADAAGVAFCHALTWRDESAGQIP